MLKKRRIKHKIYAYARDIDIKSNSKCKNPGERRFQVTKDKEPNHAYSYSSNVDAFFFRSDSL